MKKSSIALTCIFLLGITSLAQGMHEGDQHKQTRLLIRAQDDETEGGLKLKISIPKEIQNGPVDDNIEIIEEEKDKIAILDNNGNFLNYEIDKKGNIVPGIILIANGLASSTGKWPPTRAKIILIKERKKTEKTLDVKKLEDSEHYYINIGNKLFSENFDRSLLEKNKYSPIPLKTEDSKSNSTISKNVDKMPFFDAVSTFGTVWTVFDMYEKDINNLNVEDAINKWRERGKVRVYPHMTKNQLKKLYPKDTYEENLGNAFYNYRPEDKEGPHVLCFFPTANGESYTSHSFDVVAHEAGHNVLNIFRPDLWNSSSNDISAFHESFGDMSALFAVLSFSELRIRILEKTKGNLHFPSFLSVIGERIVDRDTTNYTKISVLPSCEEHDLSERLTRALYGTLADFFNSKRTGKNFIPIEDKNLESLLENVGQLFRLNYLKTILTSKLTSFIEFGRDFRSNGEPLFQQLVHVNFLRQGIELTDMLLTPQICLLKKKDTLSSKPLGCVTGKLNTLEDYSVYDSESTDFNSNSFNNIFNKKSSITNKKKFY